MKKKQKLLSYIFLISVLISEQKLMEKISITGFNLFLLLILFCLYYNKKIVIKDKKLLYLNISIILTTFCYLLFGQYGENYYNIILGIQNIIVVYLIVLYFTNLNFEITYKIYRKFCYIIIFSIYFQFIFLLCNINLDLKNKFIYVFQTIEIGRMYRISSIFSEPAHLIQYLLIFLSIELYRGNINLFLLTSLAMLLTTSSLGVIMILFIFVFIKLKKISFKQIIIVILILVSSYLIIFSLKEKILFFSRTLKGSSMSSRILLGIETFIGYPLELKLIGVGFNNLSSYYKKIVILDKYGIRWYSEYSSTYVYMFLTGGIVIGIQYIRYTLSLFLKKNRDRRYKVICFILIVISITSMIYGSRWWWFYMGWIYSLNKDYLLTKN